MRGTAGAICGSMQADVATNADKKMRRRIRLSIDVYSTLRIVSAMKTLKRILVLALVLFLKLLLVSAIVALIASFFSTQRVIGSLSEIGAETQFGDRVSMILYDAIHFGSLYWAFISLAFLFAFASAWALHKGIKFGRPIIFTVAGIAAMLVMLLAMERVFFGVPIVAGARDTLGILLQMVAGDIGGFVFARLTASKPVIKKAPI